MRKSRLVWFTFSLFLINILIQSSLISNTKGATDISYIFDDNVLIDSAITGFNETFNLRESSYYTEHYNGTYSFENEIDGTTGTSIDFVDSATGGIIISDYLNHSKVLLINGSIATKYIEHHFDNRHNGTVEFWFSITETTNHASSWDFYDTSGLIVSFQVVAGVLRYNDGGWNTIFSISKDTWYHLRFEWYTDDTFDFYVNGIKETTVGDFINNQVNGLNRFRFYSVNPYSIYIDGYGESWSLVYGSIDYIYNFNELTANLEFSTTGIYSTWSYTKDANTDIYIRDSVPIDNEFLRFQDDNNNGYPKLRIPLVDSITNAYSFYFRTDDKTKESYIFLQDGVNDRISIYVSASNLNIYDGITPTVIMALSNDVWYNISVNFNCLTDKVDIFVDSIHKGTYDFSDDSDTINYIEFRTDLFDDNDYYIDLDTFTSLAYIRNSYTIGLNFLPYLNSTGMNEVDKYEFDLESPNVLYAVSSTNHPDWDFTDLGTGFSYTVATTMYERAISLGVQINNDIGALGKNVIGATSKFINLTFDIRNYVISTTGNGSMMNFYAYSFQDNFIFIVRYTTLGVLEYFNGTGYTELRNDIGVGYYDFNFFINHELNRVFMDYIVNDVLITSYNWSTLEIGDSGLNTVICSLNGYQTDTSIIIIDSIGIYDNGVSLSNEYGYSVINTGLAWNTQINNLLFIKANGSIHIGIVEGNYYVSKTMSVFRSMTNYFNILDTINGYDTSEVYTNSTIVFTVHNHYFNISSFKIDGVLLKEGINEYSLIYEHSGINIHESYFYVSGNRLYFTHIADDTNLEYIQARFNITNVNSTDYSISYRSYIDDNAYGYMRVNYTDTSNLLQFPTILTTTRFLLSQERVVHDFIILITDKNNNGISGLTTGYVYNIELLDVLNIPISIITESLLNMMIPLIIILIPTLLFSKRFGKQVIVPFFILFSLILTMSSTLPPWLFFIIVFPSLIIIFFKSSSESEING